MQGGRVQGDELVGTRCEVSAFLRAARDGHSRMLAGEGPDSHSLASAAHAP